MTDFLGVLAGAIVTWFVSRWYYVRAGQELRAEADRLRRHTTLILNGLANAGMVELNRGADGEIVGMNARVILGGGIAPSGALVAELQPAANPRPASGPASHP